MTKKVAVFGSEGEMGKFIVRLFKELGYQIISVDPKNPNLLSTSEAIKQSQVLFLSVSPTSQIKDIIDKNLDLFKNHCVIDNASVKKSLYATYKKLGKKRVSICSTNPLCKPDLPVTGQKVIVMPFGDNSKKATKIAIALYKKAGMSIVLLPFEKHDQTMLLIQFLPHLVMRAVGRILEKEYVDLPFIEKLASANFQLFDLSFQRTLMQNPQISAEIIYGSIQQSSGKRIYNLLESAFAEIVNQKDENSLSEFLQQSKQKVLKHKKNQIDRITKDVLQYLAASKYFEL